MHLYLHVCAQSCLNLCDPMDHSPPDSSVLGILQARILEWVAMPSSRGSSQPRDQTHVSCISCIGRRILYHCTTWEVLNFCYANLEIFQCPIFLPFHTFCGVLKVGDGQGGLVCSSPWGRKELDTTKQLNLEIFLTLYYHYAIQIIPLDFQVCNKG